MEKTKIVQTKGKNDNLRVKFDIIQSLRELFAENLNEMYWTEKSLLNKTPSIVSNSYSSALKQVLTLYMDETSDNLIRLEKIFEHIEENVVPKKCDAMESLINEVEYIAKEIENGQLRDTKIIVALKKIKHYKIASYRRLFAFATTLGDITLAKIISQMLNEEKVADEILTEIALENIHI